MVGTCISGLCETGLATYSTTVRAKTLFATHYHELTSLGDSLPTVQNVHVAADERDGDVTFMRTVREGPTNRSYGVHVADLAGVPEPVVARSREVLDRLRDDKAIEVRGADGGDEGPTQAVFDLSAGQFGGASADGENEPDEADPLDPATEQVLDELRRLDVNETPPVELMAKVQGWQDELDAG